ncbi:CHASE domain-containing protein [uncultured Sunxiuqinia sp.]|uniref:CHASE domain-containing protein n=1 Tax=uncultured Sunxiuqinia sp. TaxID=1573825 RepID=UPI002AA91588|nr:CHASE domain-containing protein [uncultured Sunxiuqinia sp.]
MFFKNSKDKLSEHIQEVRNNGFSDYVVWPENERDVYTSIIYLEPFNEQNKRAFGYDMMTEPVRKEAMERARDMDVASLSGKVLLVQESGTDVQAGNLMYVPVYQKGVALNTVEQRRKALIGWVYSPYRMTDLISRILLHWELEENLNKYYLNIYDGLNQSAESLLFKSNEALEQESSDNIRFELEFPIDFNSHHWTLVFIQKKGNLFMDHASAWSVLVGGFIISILLLLLVRSLINTKYNAQKIAISLTSELQESERLLKESQEIASLGSYSFDIETGVWKSSEILNVILGIDKNYTHSIEGWKSLLHPDYKEQIIDSLNETIVEKIFFDKEFKIIRYNDNQERWVKGLGKLEYDSNNNPKTLIGTVIDITDRKRAEMEIQSISKRLQLATSAANIGIWEYDVFNNSLIWDDVMYSLYGISPETFSGAYEAWESGLHPDDLVRGREEIQMALRGEKEFITEFRVIRPDKSVHHIDATGIVIRDNSGNALRMLGTNIDVTEKKNAEKLLKESEKRLRTIIEASPIPFVLTKISDGVVIMANKSLGKLFKISVSEVIGQKSLDFYHSKKERDSLLDIVAKDGYVDNYEMLLKKSDGELFWCSVSLKLMTLDDEQILIAGFHDITKRKLVEEEILKHREHLEEMVKERTRELTISEQKLQKSVKDISDYKLALDESSLVSITNDQGIIHYANDNFCKVSKFSRDELVGNSHKIINSGFHSSAFFANLWGTIAKGQVWRGEIKNKAKDGSLYWLDTTIVPFLDKKGKPYQYISIRFDITNRKSIEADLIKSKEAADSANRAKSEFLANMSHEIRTPMNAVIGFSELLSKSVEDKKQLSQVESIRNSGKNLLKIINDILDLSKIEAGKIDITPIPVNLCDLLREIENMFILKVKEKGITLSIDYEKIFSKTLLLDEVRFRQILFNLIGNAVKFTDKGSVSISIENKKNSEIEESVDLTVLVKDTGIGIPVDQQELIFAPFNQQRGQSVEKFGGTGLGLSITKKLVEKMGGNMSLESEVGKGSTFGFNLFNIPVLDIDIDIDSEKKAFDTSTVLFEPATVLIVDDNDENLKLIVDMLDYSPLSLLQAANGEEAIKLAEKHIPDLILMDLRMPVMGGIKASEIIRTNATTKSIPIIMLTASTKKLKSINTTDKYFDEFLIKPLNMEEFFYKLKKYLKHNTIESENSSLANSVDSITFTFSTKQKKKLPEFIKILESELMPEYEKALKNQVINEIEEFGKKFRMITQETGFSMFEQYGKDIETFADSFDFNRLMQTLRKFPEFIKRLKTEP